jgi:hypothetical protein
MAIGDRHGRTYGGLVETDVVKSSRDSGRSSRNHGWGSASKRVASHATALSRSRPPHAPGGPGRFTLLTGDLAPCSIERHGHQHLAHLPLGSRRAFSIARTQRAACPDAWGIARSAQGAVHHLRRSLRFCRRHCPFHVWHRRVAHDLPGVADGHEVGGRCLPRLARHSSLAVATHRHRSPWFSATQSRLVAVPARGTLRTDQSQGASLLRCFSSAIHRPRSKSLRPVRHHGWNVCSNRNSYRGVHRQHGSSHQPMASASRAALQPGLRRGVHGDRGRTAPTELSGWADMALRSRAARRLERGTSVVAAAARTVNAAQRSGASPSIGESASCRAARLQFASAGGFIACNSADGVCPVKA